MAKNWFDGPVPTPEIGLLGGLPSLELTDEDKKRALAQLFQQGGLQMMAASLAGANTAQAAGKGLLGGASAYEQGLMAPQGRFDAYAKQLKVQGDQIGNAKGLEELGKLKREASDYSKQNDFLSMLNDPGQAAMLYGGGPTVANEQRATQFGQNPAAMLSDPRINLRALQARVDPKQLGAALENTRPYMQDPGKYYNGQYLPDPTKGVTIKDGQVVTMDGAPNALGTLTAAQEWAKVNPQKALKAFEMNNQLGTDINSGTQFRIGSTTPVIGAPNEGGQGGMPQAGAPRQVALTPAQLASQANIAKGNDVWREQTLIPILKAESSARSNNDQLTALDNIDLKTGFGTEALAALSSPFAALGYKPAEKYTKSVESFRSIVNDQQLNKQMQQAGVQTEGDAKRSMATLAQLGNTPEANAFIKDYARAVNNAVLAKAQFYSAAHNHALERGESNLTKLDSTWRKASYSIWDDPVLARWKR